MSPPIVILGRADVALDALEDEVVGAFEALADATRTGTPVVVVLDDDAVAGTTAAPAVALAHALLGLVRAFAIEGRKAGWRVNALALPDGVSAEERDRWVECLSAEGAPNGSLIRLGHGHLGKLPA